MSTNAQKNEHASRFERWLDTQKTVQARAEAEHKKEYPDRYFVAFVKITTPRSSLPERLWPRVINETLIFEQPEQVTYEDIMRVAKKAWPFDERIEITNFYEMNADDYAAFKGDDNEWGVIEE